MTRRPIFPTPRPPSLAAVTGGSGRGCPTYRARGGGGDPTYMAQNDTHVALIILTTQMWGGGGGNYWWKKLFRAKICVPAPSAPTSVLTQNKGPDTEPHFSNPPPPLLRRASMSPPPPPPAEQFSGRLAHHSPAVHIPCVTTPSHSCHPSTHMQQQNVPYKQHFRGSSKLTRHQHASHERSESNQPHFQLAIHCTALHMHNTLFQPKIHGNNTRC